MKILSLFDGMACGMLAMQSAGINVDRYVAFEIDKYAVQTSSHNFPMIEHRGDVFKGDFTEFRGFDFLIGGSPCTKWSIAQKNGRETEASGIGWELFCQYVRALNEAKPKYFIYENNKSMHNNIRTAITEAFGFEPICINSALLSAQNRQRLYWVGRRNADGTYSRINVDQPEDMGILLRDVLDGVADREKGTMAYEPVSFTMSGTFGSRRASVSDKAYCLAANPSSDMTPRCIEPVAINTTADGDKARTLMAGYYKYGTATLITNEGFTGGTTAVAEPVCVETNLVPFVVKKLDEAVKKYGYIPEIYNPYNNAEITEKHPTLTAQCGSQTSSSSVFCIVPAIPCEWDADGKPTKAVSGTDGKTYPVYEVKDGLITIKGKQYPIKLADGFYIIRKLTVSECKRLQTVPEWFVFPVSDSQAYKLLGNGWTVLVIAHLIRATQI